MSSSTAATLHCYSWQTGVQVQHSCHTSLPQLVDWCPGEAQLPHFTTSLIQLADWCPGEAQLPHFTTMAGRLVSRCSTAATLHYFTATASRLVSRCNTAATHNCLTATQHLISVCSYFKHFLRNICQSLYSYTLVFSASPGILVICHS